MESNATAAVREPSRAELLARIAELEAQNKARTVGGLKVSEKGAISTYGIGKFPVTLYLSQAEKMQEIWGENYCNLKAFIAAHRSELSVKPDKA
jgi:hypothetical protein